MMIQLLIALLTVLVTMWGALEIIHGRFNKSVYSFEQYGMQFKVVRSFRDYNVIRLTPFKTTKVKFIFFLGKHSTEDIKEKARDAVDEYYPWEREAYEEFEAQLRASKDDLNELNRKFPHQDV